MTAVPLDFTAQTRIRRLAANAENAHGPVLQAEVERLTPTLGPYLRAVLWHRLVTATRDGAETYSRLIARVMTRKAPL